jgi:AcrR family transcriptional regulator
MARPRLISDELILSTARDVFLERGLRATTAEIAEKAGISQGILFQRYKNKEVLFRAAMSLDEDPHKPLPIDLDTRVGVGRVEDTLTELGHLLIKKFFAIVPTTMLDWSHSRESVEDPQYQTGADRAAIAVKKIADYLKKEAKLGRIADVNCEVLAQTFVGAIWHYSFLRVALGGQGLNKPVKPSAFIDELVQILMRGVATKS